MVVNSKATFSGHETFQCRHLWLKKGYDYIESGRAFNDEDAVVALGVGKNMVTSIRYWMRAFDLMDEEGSTTDFARFLFDDEEGHDPYLEDDASLWLLHLHLVRKGFATTYNLIFNELRKDRIEFSKEHFVRFMQSKDEAGLNFTFNKNTIETDFEVFVKLYVGTTESSKDKEEVVSGILPDLRLVNQIPREKQTLYHIETTEKEDMPEEVMLYAILTGENTGMSISLDEIERSYNSPGSVFALSRAGIVQKIEGLCDTFDFLVYNDNAGVRELQFKEKIDPFKILEVYYGNQI